MPNHPLSLSAKARRTTEQPISFLMSAALGNPRLINLAAGFVDPRTLPVEATQTITAKILSDPVRARAALQYDTTQGLTALRRACLQHLEKLEQVSADQMGLTDRDLVITSGSQQALYLIGDVLLDPGDIVIAANPCYFVFTSTLASFGATVLTAPMTERGIDAEAVDRLLARLDKEGRLDRVKLIYTTTYFQNPTGLTLDLPGRRKLIEIAKRYSKRHRLLILEDAAYRELRYDGPSYPSMKTMDPDNQHTILAQTFSKPFAPGIKTGYAFMPRDLLDAVLHQKGNHDFGTSCFNQHIACEALTSGLYESCVKTLCASYGQKRDAMLDALQRHLGGTDGVQWTRPGGGLYVWLTLPASVDSARGGALFTDAVRGGVLYVPGDYCFQPDESGFLPRNHLRLSFGQVAPEQIEPGIARLAESVAHVLGGALVHP